MDLKNKKQKVILCFFLYVLGSALLIYLSGMIDSLLSGNGASATYLGSLEGLCQNPAQRSIFLIFNVLLITACTYMAVADFHAYKSNVVKITDDIHIPAKDGQNQHGSARFATEEEKKTLFCTELIDPALPLFKKMLDDGEAGSQALAKEAAARDRLGQPGIKDEGLDPASYVRDLGIEIEEGLLCGEPMGEAEYNLLKDKEHGMELAIDYDALALEYEDLVNSQGEDENAKAQMAYIRETVISQEAKPIPFRPPFQKGGLVVGMEKCGKKEKWFLATQDTHNIIVGATRSGKTRCLVIQSIFAMAMGGESIVVTDPKAELYHYTADFLENECAYKVCCIDFRTPPKSDRYNLLQPTIDAINRGDIEKADESAWDLTNILVGDDSHGEKIWTNGEKAIVAAAIMSVVYDNRNHPEFQNLTNVYWFVAEMAKEIQVGTRMRSPLEEYAKALKSDHPAKATFAIADVAPGRTKGSFYTSALTTLKLFNMRYMYGLTNATDIDIAEAGRKRMALFLILPDEKTTYYPIASLIISQLYELLVRQSDERGGRLLNRVNFLCDEFGNFSKLTDFTNKLTVAGGRGMRFHLFLQSFTQLEQKYDKETAAIIKGNCETWVYLKTEDTETHEEITKKLDKYTTSGYQISASHSKYANPQSSHSVSLLGRDLMTPGEVGRIKRPWQLVICRGLPVMLKSFDLSQLHLNKMLSMGDEGHNTGLRISREEKRERRAAAGNLALWGIWDEVGKVLEDWNSLFIRTKGEIPPEEYGLIKMRLSWAASGTSKENKAREAKAYQQKTLREKTGAAQKNREAT
ncbi:MAG: type IV secretory system conjugative DNA transfer family protein [Lachnospiraceae bacterium]|nr:type IV secretory system conjugative DNA transfer family protein [Lachnospiraceae bacterium]